MECGRESLISPVYELFTMRRYVPMCSSLDSGGCVAGCAIGPLGLARTDAVRVVSTQDFIRRWEVRFRWRWRLRRGFDEWPGLAVAAAFRRRDSFGIVLCKWPMVC